MREYELTVIVSPQLTDENLNAVMEKIKRWVTEKGGNNFQIESQGKRRLAYPIKKSIEGNYLLVRFRAEPALITELETNLKMSEDVLRHLLIKAGE